MQLFVRSPKRYIDKEAAAADIAQGYFIKLKQLQVGTLRFFYETKNK